MEKVWVKVNGADSLLCASLQIFAFCACSNLRAKAIIWLQEKEQNLSKFERGGS